MEIDSRQYTTSRAPSDRTKLMVTGPAVYYNSQASVPRQPYYGSKPMDTEVTRYYASDPMDVDPTTNGYGSRHAAAALAQRRYR